MNDRYIYGFSLSFVPISESRFLPYLKIFSLQRISYNVSRDQIIVNGELSGYLAVPVQKRCSYRSKQNGSNIIRLGKERI
jgi:hypothetical protein